MAKDAGKVGFSIRGDYDSTATYERLDVVNYNNAIYAATQTVTGVAPGGEGDEWFLLLPDAASLVTELLVNYLNSHSVPSALDSSRVNGHTVLSDVPANANFENTEYGLQIHNKVLSLVVGGSDASVTIPDDNITYTLTQNALNPYILVLTPSVGQQQTVTIPQATTIPGANITGIIPIEHIPSGALDRLVTVADDTARYALTTDDVQNGDSVYVESTQTMYYVVDQTKLNQAAGYKEYTAGHATSVPWSGVTDKVEATTSAAGIMSATDKTKLDSVATNAEVNQNAFSSIVIGSDTIAANGKTAAIELIEGDNVTLTADTTNRTVTIAADLQWKDIAGTLAAGSTSITLQDQAIKTNSTISVFTDVFDVNPSSVTVAAGSVTLTFPAQSSALGVKVRVS